MTFKLKIAALFAFLLCIHTTEAQFFKKLQNKIEKKIEQRLEKKADQKADQALDTVFEGRKSKKRRKASPNDPRIADNDSDQSEKGGFDLGKMMEAAMNREPATYKQTYDFDVTTTMVMIFKGQKPMTVTTSYSDKAHYIKMDKGTTIINDFGNESMITINEDNKTAQAMSMSLLKAFKMSDTEEVVPEEISISKTGKTKRISGYNCKEYLITGKDFKTQGWFTDEVDFDMATYAQSMSEIYKDDSSKAIFQEDIGFPIQMTTTANNKETVEMLVTDISQKPSTVDLSGYKISQL